MAGGNIIRIVGGKNTIETEEWIVYTDKFTAYANGGSHFTADCGTNFGEPKDTPPAGKYFVKGWWSDEKGREIKEATIGETVVFNIQMDKSKVPAKSKINFTLMDWDGMLNPDDPITLYSTTKDLKTNTYPEIKEMFTDANGKASVYITLTEGLIQFMEDDGGNEIELYFDCGYYDISDKESEQLYLPIEEFNYLVVYEKEVLITVLIELPHSHYSLVKAIKNLDKNEALSALGLAGHSAMAIGERYFDFGLDYDLNNDGNIGDVVRINEKDYDYDFNNDGDKNDIIDFQENRDPTNAPGRPWWGEMVAGRLGIKAENVKLSQVLDFIKLHWFNDGTNIYGEVHKVEFYVKESEAKRMIAWWEERYKHLKLYSVYPWKGEQCTTAVKSAIQEGYPLNYGKVINRLSDVTQRPSGLLDDLSQFISSSKQHFNQPAVNEIIKPEANDYPKK